MKFNYHHHPYSHNINCQWDHPNCYSSSQFPVGINPDFEMDIVGDYTVRCVGSGSTVPTTFTDELMHLKFEGIHVG